MKISPFDKKQGSEMQINIEPKALSRSQDPVTSKKSALRVDEFAENLCSKIYQELKRGEGTFEQLAERLKLRPDQIWRRLPDLQKAGYAEPTEKEHAGASGRLKRVWRAL
jgi:predicted ArsR family transcriptional regulator